MTARRDEDGRATYVDERYGYALVHPADWSVDAGPDGTVSFDAPGARGAGVSVFVDRLAADADLDGYVAAFLAALDDDAHVHALEVARRRPVTLAGGREGRRVDGAYVGDDPGARWRFAYVFVVADGVGYTVGADWNDAEAFAGTAAGVVESFALGADGGSDATGDEN